jgi:hypothetical protein
MPAAGGAVSVLTQKYDNARTGWNASERVLTPDNVAMSFGKLFTRTVDGQIYAQPLLVAGLAIGGKTRNVVYVVTTHNSAYAFDADDKAVEMPLWQANMGPTIAGSKTPHCCNIQPEVGTIATPAIDAATRTIYFASKHLENAKEVYKLHALDIVTGMPKPGSPKVIEGSVPGTGDGAAGGMIAFNTRMHLARAGLLLQRGTVYVGFASHGDARPYHGWVFSYDAATLAQKAIFNTSPGSWGAGIWASGIGLVGDADGNVYFSTGNGGTNPDPASPNLGEALVKLDKDLKLADWHIRGNYAQLDGADADYGMGGPVLLPKGVLVTGGKDAWAFAYDRNALGKYKADDTNTLQKFKGTGTTVFAGMHSGTFIYWDANQMGPTLYGWPGNSRLLGFKFNGTKFDETPIVVGTTPSPAVWSWGCMVGSSNGAMNGIIWAPTSVGDNPNERIVPGKLRAINASDGKIIFDSTTNKARDDVGLYAAFSYATVANGKVYVPSWSGSTSTVNAGALHVYGLLP